LINDVEIGFIRSFRVPQSLEFATPNGKPGSGYNIIVGKNNSGKSTLLKTMRDLASQLDYITIGQEARVDPNRPTLTMGVSINEKSEKLGIKASTTGGFFAKTGPFTAAGDVVRYVPSRRPFSGSSETRCP
jgi:predicted ATPase